MGHSLVLLTYGTWAWHSSWLLFATSIASTHLKHCPWMQDPKVWLIHLRVKASQGNSKHICKHLICTLLASAC